MMKTKRTLKILTLLLALAMILPMAVACGQTPSAPDAEESTAGDTLASTEGTTDPSTPEDPADPPAVIERPTIALDPNASVYSGTPDTSWYTGDKTEYILTSADQLVGFQMLRTEKASFEGITIKLGCDVIFNPGTIEEILARGSQNHVWKDLHSDYFFRGTFDGQGHTVSGIYMQLTTAAYSSMFGSAAGKATFKNLNLINAYFGGPDTTEGKAVMAGLISKITEEGSEVTVSNINIMAYRRKKRRRK